MQKVLAVFQKTNGILTEYDENYAEVYSDIRAHFIKLFETIFNKSNLLTNAPADGRSEREKLLFRENELLKARVQQMSSQSPRKNQPRQVVSVRKSPSPSPSPQATSDARLKELTGKYSPSPDKGQGEQSQEDTQLTLANTQNWKRENSFLKGFTKSEAGNSLKDVLFKPFSEQVMTEFIKELLQLKKAHDVKTTEGGFARETMEQFMYGYLKNKYGLQPVVIERVLSITMAIQEFAEKNDDIAAFGLVG